MDKTVRLKNLMREAVRAELTAVGYDERQRWLESHRLLTKTDVCAILGLSETTIEDMIGRGELHMTRIRGQYRITQKQFNADLARLMEGN